MYVKSEPDCDFDMNMELMTDVETTLLREELFGNHYIPCESNRGPIESDLTTGLENQQALDTFLRQMGLTTAPADVSESSSDDDLINKLSSELEIPLPLDGFEPVSSWPPDTKDILETFTHSDISSVFKSEGDLTAEELTKTFYPNMECSTGQEISGTVSQVANHRIKQEPCSPHTLTQMPPSPDEGHDIWELLCDADIKPSFKSLITPPVTPPQNEGSPPNSPQPPSPLSPSATVMVSPPTSQVQGGSRNATNPVQPIKVLTITTRNGAPSKVGRVTKTMKIQPKVATNSASQPQVISIVNSSNGQKITIPKSVVTTRSLPTAGARVVQLKPPPTPARVTTSTAVSSPLPSILTTQIGSASTVLTAPPATTPLTPLAPALTPGMKHGNIPDLKALKRQQRMIKNRESASLSRKKKKEYVTALEGNISELKGENDKLRKENARLHQRVASLENECTSLRHAIGRNPSRKTTTALFALIFLLSLNLGPLTGVLLSSESRLSSLKTMMQGNEPSSITSGFKHRSLLWSANDVTATEEGVTSQFGNASYMCPMYINATESLRLETELRGLFENKLGSSKQDNKKKEKIVASHPKTKVGRSGVKSHTVEKTAALNQGAVGRVWNALAPPSANIEPSTKLYHYVHPDILQVEPSTSNEENTSVMATLPRLSSFLEAIQRRDDTYYVVSFSPDHLLVPATARNDSARPRMSLLMPTPRPMNDSLAPPAAHIAMMQIDCEVIHTRLVHVAEEVVPPHLRAGGSNASHPTPDTTASHRQERRSSRGKARPFFSKSNYPAK